MITFGILPDEPIKSMCSKKIEKHHLTFIRNTRHNKLQTLVQWSFTQHHRQKINCIRNNTYRLGGTEINTVLKQIIDAFTTASHLAPGIVSCAMSSAGEQHGTFQMQAEVSTLLFYRIYMYIFGGTNSSESILVLYTSPFMFVQYPGSKD